MTVLRLALVIFVISSAELCLDSDAQADGHDFGSPDGDEDVWIGLAPLQESSKLRFTV
jgi:hypothetical protein